MPSEENISAALDRPVKATELGIAALDEASLGKVRREDGTHLRMAGPQDRSRGAGWPRDRPVVLFIWDRFGPYHVDRCEAAARHFEGHYDVYGIEIASFDDIYRWKKSAGGDAFTQVTLFAHRRRLSVNPVHCFLKLAWTSLRLRARYVFACNYEDPVIFSVSVLLRLLGRPVIIMQDSKFDDKQRRVWWECVKYLCYAPYCGALAGGARSASYLQFLGLPRERIFIGYDTVSVARIVRQAGSPPAPDGIPHRDRHFTVVARFVSKKNLGMALDAYAEYIRTAVGPVRELHLCGSGELEDDLRAQCARLQLGTVRFRGFMQEQGVAQALAASLALILPSTEEQHGLVVNEAIAMGVPILLSDNCGSRDLLVRSGINGFIVEPDNAAGLAHFMSLLDRDEAEWRRLSLGSAQFVAAADTGHFTAAVERALDALTTNRRASRDVA
jgi:glycosyltransferase involved in cell wall biosynthesis